MVHSDAFRRMWSTRVCSKSGIRRTNPRHSEYRLKWPGTRLTKKGGVTLKPWVDRSWRLRSNTSLRADWEVTIMPCGHKPWELFLILQRTTYSTKLRVNKTDVVTVCLFRIFTFEQIILNPFTVAKQLVVLIDLEYSCVVIFAKRTTAVGAILKYTNTSSA